MLAEGRALLRACLRRGRPGPYQLQAAIAAVHADASTAEETDWPQVLRIYDDLLTLSGTPVVALNRAVALAEVHGPAAALAEVESIDLGGHLAHHAVRADLLRRLRRPAEAEAAYADAQRTARTPADLALLERARRRRQQRPGGGGVA